MLSEVRQECFREIKRLLSAYRMQRNVNLSVFTHGVNISFHLVARMNPLENLVFISQCRIGIIDDNLESEFCLLPNQHVYFMSAFHVGNIFIEEFLYLCRCYDAITLLVDIYVNDVRLTDFHLFLLFMEGTKQVFHQSPLQECTVLVYPRHFQVSKLAYFAKWFFRGSYQSLLII